jgi:hypothetical protein
MIEIAIYAEGGGDTAEQKAELRQGFDGLLDSIKSKARVRRIRWKLVCAGDRKQAYDAFIHALRTNPNAVNVLLVDSETQVKANNADIAQDARIRVEHLTQGDGWDLSTANPQTVHLMAQCMEAWIVADADALEEFYRQGFLRNVLPSRINLEDEPKKDVYDKLAKATRSAQKGEYRKIKHAGQLLQKIDATKVAGRCPRFSKLTHWLEATITTVHSVTVLLLLALG